MAIFQRRRNGFTDSRNIIVTPGVIATPPNAWIAIFQSILDYEGRIAAGEAAPANIVGPGVTVVTTSNTPFEVHRFINFTANFTTGTYTFDYDTTAANNESLP